MSLSPRQHLEALRRVFPRAKRIGVIFDPAQTGGYVREAQAAAAALNLTLVTREIAQPGEFSRRLEELRGQVDVIWMLPDPTVLQGENLNALLLASFESRVPLYGFARKYVELGAVAASQFDFAALGAQVAELIRRRRPRPPASPRRAGSTPAARNSCSTRKSPARWASSSTPTCWRPPQMSSAERSTRFSHRVFVGLTFLLLVVSVIFTAYFLYVQKQRLEAALVDRGRGLAGLLATGAKVAVYSENEELVQETLGEWSIAGTSSRRRSSRWSARPSLRPAGAPS